eukprot:CAMPEP_0119387718 /NCGR_PEP_ID=MMETSP1334-20130426/101882_1 /TAXON_ID=127549 /ORGANISM="Calcidiscus leptoporus, Strain RCC1130" /LENGTH=80 /DNA_ID=CAMNT_0007409517 /DNA_START=83 /DNA_END=322 /DNA_ORIENTATION=-
MRKASALDRSWVSGYCAETNDKEAGSCHIGDMGVLGLPKATARAGWQAAEAHCLDQCARCARCNFVSLSLQHADCSWYFA